MANTLLGIFSNRMNAEGAISELEAQGFNPKDISIIMRDQNGQTTTSHPSGSHAVEGAVSGAATGGVLGGLAGLLVGIGAVAIPGIGALLIAGPLAAALGLTGVAATTVSAAVTGALAGGLVGGLIGLGVPEEEAKAIEGRIKEGGILVAVPVLLEEEAKVRKIFRDFGADMIRAISNTSREREVYNQNYQAYEPRANEYQEPVYYSDVRAGMRDYDQNLNDLADRGEYKYDRRSFWQKLKDLFR